MIRITSKKENFRRCGVAHPKAATEYADDKFSKKELAVLNAEPMLVVTRAEDKEIAQTPALNDMTVKELKALLDKLKVPYADKATKGTLISFVEANTAEPPAEG